MVSRRINLSRHDFEFDNENKRYKVTKSLSDLKKAPKKNGVKNFVLILTNDF